MLVGTILSQNTTDVNSAAGYRRLCERFADWDAVADAPVSAIERCIRVSGLSRTKAPRIRRILRAIRADRGRLDLAFLRRLEPAAARRYLLAFDGVGPKTADCVLLFGFGCAVFPVDTHVHRVARRLGWVAEGATAEQTHDLLEPRIDPPDRYAMHVLLIAHGRRTCRARTPACAGCVLRRSCAYGGEEAAKGGASRRG